MTQQAMVPMKGPMSHLVETNGCPDGHYPGRQRVPKKSALEKDVFGIDCTSQVQTCLGPI